MRKLILLAVAFLLFAAPAYAAVTAEVEVNIDWLNNLVIDGDAYFDIGWTDISNTYATDADCINVSGYSNDAWDLLCIRDAWDNGAPWEVEVETVEVNTATATVILNAQAASGSINIDLDVSVTGLALGNCGSGDDDACQLTFSMAQD